jgi:hypothetical protein
VLDLYASVAYNDNEFSILHHCCLCKHCSFARTSASSTEYEFLIALTQFGNELDLCAEKWIRTQLVDSVCEINEIVSIWVDAEHRCKQGKSVQRDSELGRFVQLGDNCTIFTNYINPGRIRTRLVRAVWFEYEFLQGLIWLWQHNPYFDAV